MPNRVIKDSIWTSPTLAKLPIDAQLHWPRWLLMADDWGCFNADPAVIFGLVYPKMKGMTVKKVEALLNIYYEAGLIFTWQSDERQWGYFSSWNGHQYCNGTHLDDEGKQVRHKRKTPEPPEDELNQYLSGKLERDRAVQNKYRNPNPIPNPIPNHNHNPALAGFERFWKAYPKKLSKGQAKKAWLKIRPSEQLLETMISTIERAKTSEQWTNEKGQYIPHPATWLNAEGWEDEYTTQGTPDAPKVCTASTPMPQGSQDRWRHPDAKRTGENKAQCPHCMKVMTA